MHLRRMLKRALRTPTREERLDSLNQFGRRGLLMVALVAHVMFLFSYLVFTGALVGAIEVVTGSSDSPGGSGTPFLAALIMIPALLLTGTGLLAFGIYFARLSFPVTWRILQGKESYEELLEGLPSSPTSGKAAKETVDQAQMEEELEAGPMVVSSPEHDLIVSARFGWLVIGIAIVLFTIHLANFSLRFLPILFLAILGSVIYFLGRKILRDGWKWKALAGVELEVDPHPLRPPCTFTARLELTPGLEVSAVTLRFVCAEAEILECDEFVADEDGDYGPPSDLFAIPIDGDFIDERTVVFRGNLERENFAASLADADVEYKLELRLEEARYNGELLGDSPRTFNYPLEVIGEFAPQADERKPKESNLNQQEGSIWLNDPPGLAENTPAILWAIHLLKKWAAWGSAVGVSPALFLIIRIDDSPRIVVGDMFGAFYGMFSVFVFVGFVAGMIARRRRKIRDHLIVAVTSGAVCYTSLSAIYLILMSAATGRHWNEHVPDAGTLIMGVLGTILLGIAGGSIAGILKSEEKKKRKKRVSGQATTSPPV